MKGASEPKNRKSSPVIGHETGTDVNWLIEATSGSLKGILQKLVPPDLRKQLALSLEYANGKSDIIQSIIQTKVDFYAAGFSVTVQPKRKTSLESLKKRIADFISAHQLQRIAEELVFDFTACDNAILHWKVVDGEISYVTTLAPDRVEFDNSTGIETLKLHLSDDIRKNILDTMKKIGKGDKSPFPDKYVEAARRGKPVILDNKDGEYWLVRSRCRRFTGLAKPSMASIYGDIQLRELLISGDWSVAYFIAHVIHQIKAGEAITGGPLAGTRNNYVTKTAINKLKKVFQEVSQTLRIFTDHTVDIKYHYPDPNVFNPQKFEKAEERILRWGAVIDVIMTGKGDGFSQGSLGKNRFEAQGNRVRGAIGWMFGEFFGHPTVTKALQIPDESTVEIGWNQQNLKEWAQVLKELQFQWDNGGMDWETIHDRLGENHELIMERKAIEKPQEDLWRPLFEPRQGLLSNEDDPAGEDPGTGPGTPGRPQTNPIKAPNPPRPTRGGA
jgi:hypothetical protein